MIPQYIKDVFVDVENDIDGTFAIQQEYYSEDMGSIVDTYESAYWCRLSAPGYMDCTDWTGPFDTIKEARESIIELWEVDPDTGDRLEDSND